VAGSFEGVTRLLRGLEDQPRLYHVQEMNIESKDGGNGSSIEADLKFSVYNLSGDSGENADSSESAAADI
jgi:hypothetical protein